MEGRIVKFGRARYCSRILCTAKVENCKRENYCKWKEWGEEKNLAIYWLIVSLGQEDDGNMPDSSGNDNNEAQTRGVKSVFYVIVLFIRTWKAGTPNDHPLEYLMVKLWSFTKNLRFVFRFSFKLKREYN